MSITYAERAGNSNEVRERADHLINGRSYHNEVQNNVAMLRNILGHTLLDLADMMDRVAALESRSIGTQTFGEGH